jgi:hypothetical protein
MTTNVIDTTFHGSSFPSTYVGPGTLIGNPISDGPDAGGQGVGGYFTSNGNATQILLGFVATKVKVINTTDGITWEWQRGVPAANSVKTTLGGSLASVQDTSSQITVTGSVADGTGGNGSVTLGATLCGTAKNITYEIS